MAKDYEKYSKDELINHIYINLKSNLRVINTDYIGIRVLTLNM